MSSKHADDWDEAAIRAVQRPKTETAWKSSARQKLKEVEVPRSKINTIAIAFPDDEPVFACLSTTSRRSLPQRPLQALRRSCSRSAAASLIKQHISCRRNRGHAAAVFAPAIANIC